MAALRDRVVIITGASAGIGEATARRLARKGALLALAARRRDRLDALKQSIEAAAGAPTGQRVLAVQCDVTSPEDRRHLVRSTQDAFGRIDALVNNAGYGHRGPVEMVPIDDIRRNFETNVFSLIALTQLVAPVMRAQGGGRIVNVSSVAGRIARPLSSVYDATKHAIEALSDGMRIEMAPFGIRVALIEPGYIATEFMEVANAVSRPVLDQAGPYAPLLANYEGLSKKWKRAAGRADQIAALIEHAVSSPRPHIRYVAPAHAYASLFLKWLLPDRLFDYLLVRFTGVSPEKLRREARSAAAAPPGRSST
ncbi:MAG: SDR family NAD(P)-dependent oxidoreductase [Acidobacteriota bacterium]